VSESLFPKAMPRHRARKESAERITGPADLRRRGAGKATIIDKFRHVHPEGGKEYRRKGRWKEGEMRRKRSRGNAQRNYG